MIILQHLKIARIKLLIILLLCSTLSFAESINCIVIDVIDGNNFTCLTKNKQQIEVKLYLIDAPEKDQAYGYEAKQHLSSLIFNREMNIYVHSKDENNKVLGTVMKVISYNRGGNPIQLINISMILDGMAWYYPFDEHNDMYKESEEKARAKKRGLWSQKAIAPWDFRKGNK